MFDVIKSVFNGDIAKTNTHDKFGMVVEAEPQPQHVIQKPLSMNDIIKQIHFDFHNSQEDLMVMAEQLKSEETTMEKELYESQKLRELGFVRAKNVEITDQENKRIEQIKKENKEKKVLKEALDYFTRKYPYNRFITEDKVKELCGKYNLVLGKNHEYIGEVPSKNLQHILNFKVDDNLDVMYSFRRFDSDRHYINYANYKNSVRIHVRSFDSSVYIDIQKQHYQGKILETLEKYNEYENITSGSKKDLEDIGHFLVRILSMSNPMKGVTFENSSFGTNGVPDILGKIDTYDIIRNPLEMVAPVTDFELRNKKLEGHKLVDVPVKDPIVLQPVMYKHRKFYLIVTAWGQEASDESVLNPIMN